MPLSLLFGIFVLSGAAGLIFEVVWSRQLVLVFGNTTQAISAILTGFFAGLAIGSWVGGKVADRVRRPLRMYGLLESTLVLVVLLTPLSFRFIHDIYRFAFESLQTAPHSLALIRFALTILALAPATALMGATLPTLTRFLARDASGLNFAFARLYVANTMGAIFGAVIAGFVLIELFGLFGALVTGAACSGIAGVVALVFDHRMGAPSSTTPMTANNRTSPADQSRLRNALLIAFVSGLTSLAYQTLWMRLLSGGTGNSTYVFTLILSIFLTGLALGGVEYKRRQLKMVDVISVLAAGQIAIAILATIGMYALVAVDPANTASIFKWKTVAIVLPTTFVLGLCFPAAATLLGGADSQVGSRSGLLLAANTVGAIVGTFVVPFLVIPLFGSAPALGLVAIVNAATGVLLASSGSIISRRRAFAFVTAGATSGLAVAALLATNSLFKDPNVVRFRIAGTLYSTAEDQIASVQAGSIQGYKHLWVNGNGMTVLTVDTKLMPVLPLAIRPASTSALVIAFGMGSAYRAALIAGLQTDAVDLVPSVPAMFGWFYPDAGFFTGDPKGRIIIADGRNYVELTARKYDMIIVDPPPPVESSGVSVISSREFYVACGRRLNVGGVMMQWVPMAQTVADFRAHVRTFRDVFPHVIVAAGPGGNGFYMLGSREPMALEQSALRATLSRPGVLRDLSSAYDSPESTLVGWMSRIPMLTRLTDANVLAFAGEGPLVTDDRPIPEYFLLRRAFGTASRPLESDDVQVSRTGETARR
ncbi:MAG: fused MFS/spermidine synthase [Gemmatimonadaceae bacterium]